MINGHNLVMLKYKGSIWVVLNQLAFLNTELGQLELPRDWWEKIRKKM